MIETLGRLLWVPLYLILAFKTIAFDALIYRPNRDSLQGSTLHMATASGTWKNAAALPSYRYEFSSVTQGDNIYVVGGVYLPSVYTGTGQMEVYNTKTDTWSDAPALPQDVNHTAMVADGKYVYVIGGNRGRLHTTNHVYRYDPTKKTWKRMADLPTSRGALGAAIIEGKIYVVGGAAEDVKLATLEIYDIATNTWTSGPDMTQAREHLAVTAHNGNVHVLGGYPTNRFEALTTHEVYDPTTASWSKAADMPIAVAGFSAAEVAGRLYMFGGEQGWAVSKEVHEYDEQTDAWTRRADMPKGRYAFGIAVVGATIHVIGGNEILGGYQFSHDHDVFELGAK